ncbi:MAG: TlyA family RNA methyltransferase [Verrucomicrobia bacterium]|nr:TlyA family RNA methyltransferase [Verrucomicrobiota bacterium]
MASKPGKIRADELLVKLGLAPSRSSAQALILAGKVRSGPDAVVQKSSQSFPEDANLTVDQPPRFVSRGGEKLEAALEHFKISVAGLHGLDVGASTGGFTDCLLQRGVLSMTCVDVGTAQLHSKLRTDVRVTNFEKCNARDLPSMSLPQATYGIVVMDLSFISLTLVLPVAWQRVEGGGCLVALIKPQFEATKAEADKGRGVIKDPAIHARVVEVLKETAKNLPDASVLGVIPSPIEGGEGNREFLIAIKKGVRHH